MPTKKQHKRTMELMQRVEPLMEQLRVANFTKKIEIATMNADAMELAIVNCINSRNGNWRRTAPDALKFPESSLLWKLVKFHRGNGNLWGFPWFADKDKRDQLDTLALLLLGNNSNAVKNWQRVLG